MAIITTKPLSNHIVVEKHRGVFHNNDVLKQFYEAFSVNELIGEAERLKFSKHFTMAAQVLQIAQLKMYEKKEKRLEYLLKLPMYLQLAGQEYNGWLEFYRIKEQLYSYQENKELSLSELLYLESKISISMSLFQERKKEYSSAIYLTIRSYLESIIAMQHIVEAQTVKAKEEASSPLALTFIELKKQGEQYLSIRKASFQIVSMLAVILHRTNNLNLLESYYHLTKESLETLPNIDYILLEELCNSVYNQSYFK